MARCKVIGFSSVFPVTNKTTGEVSRKINVSVTVLDPQYFSGVRAQELYLSVSDQFPYDWLEVGQEVLLNYNKWGRVDSIEPV